MKSLRLYIGSLRSPLLRRILAVASGTAAAQAITMAFAPIVTRIYGPEAFGVQGAFLSLVAILTPLSALTYPIAIVLPKSDSDAVAIKRLSMLVALGIATLLFVVLLVWFDGVASLVGSGASAPYLWLLPLVVVFLAWVQVGQQWLIRKELFAPLAQTAIAQALLVNLGRVGLGLFSASATMLVVVTTVGLGVQACMQYLVGRTRPPKSVPWASILSNAREHKDFPLFRTSEMLLSAISESLPVLMLAAAFGPAEAGFYALARSVLSLPVNVIGQSVADVFYPRLKAEWLDGKPVWPLLAKGMTGLSAIGLPVFIAIALASPVLFALVFGPDWQRAGLDASLLCAWLFVMFVNRPCIGATSVLSMQRLFLAQGVLALIMRSTALYIGCFILADATWAVGLFSLASALAAAILILFVAWKANAPLVDWVENAS